jgi:hypothetical protein
VPNPNDGNQLLVIVFTKEIKIATTLTGKQQIILLTELIGIII